MKAILILLGGVAALVALVLGILAIMHKANTSAAVIVLLIALAMISIGKGL